MQQRKCLAVELEHIGIGAADDQKRRGAYLGEHGLGQIRAPAAADDGAHPVAELSRGDEGRCRAGARAEQANRQPGKVCIEVEPLHRALQALGKQRDVKDIRPILLFVAMQQIARNSTNPNLPDPSKFYCMPAAQCPAGNTSNTLAQVFASIGMDLTDSRLVPMGTQ